MALPKEPRQKMINMMYLVLTALLALNVSAEILNAFKVVDKSLQNSSTNLSSANATLYKSLKDKMNDPQSAKDAAVWEPIAEKAQTLSDQVYNYIEGLKLQLKQEAGLDSKGDFSESNLEAATRLFDTKGEGKVLESKLLAYKEAILDVDKDVQQPAGNFVRDKFGSTLPIDVTPVGNAKDFTSSFFHMTPTVAALTILSKFQNNIKNSENQVVSFIHSKIGAVIVKYDQFAALVGQTSSYLMPGDKLTITAGVGAYSAAAQPVISIGGSNAQVVDGRGSVDITASGSGEHKVPVVINYKDPSTGETKSATTEVSYTVGTPGGSAVMLDKMNVFYIGVDNPVSISSGTGDEKTHVSMTGGNISKNSAGHYTVRVSSPGKASITVDADGKKSTYEFRVKNIPPPVLKVGPSGGGRVQSVVFKNQTFARADLENFDFEYHYSVVSATVYFSGANFPSVATATISGGNLSSIAAQMQRCIPGTSITFDNVKVQGPGGPVMSIQGPGFILY